MAESRRLYFNDRREPFGITLGGQKICFITSVADVTTLYKDTAAFAFDDVVFDLTIVFGVSRDATEKVYRRPASHEEDHVARTLGIANSQLKSLAQLNGDFWKQQLLPGQEYDALQLKLLSLLQDSVRGDSLRAYTAQRSEGADTLSLLPWTQDVLVRAALKAFFGNALLDICPELPHHFLAFDEENWKLWYQFPSATAMHSAKSKITDAMEKFLALPKEQRRDAAYIVNRMEESQSTLGLTSRDIATVLTMVVFV